MSKTAACCPLKALVTVIDRTQTKKITKLLQEQQVYFNFICLAEGTAGSDIMELLGLNSSDKSLVVCLESAARVSSLLSIVSEKLQLSRKGKGIAFTIPLSGASTTTADILAKENISEGEKEMDNDKNTPKYDLILAVINPGHVNELISAAKTAGAKGGTVLQARKIEEASFLGIAAQLEKDVVAILTPREKKLDIMSAVTRSCGMKTEAKGTVFSLPVEDIAGMGDQSAAL